MISRLRRALCALLPVWAGGHAGAARAQAAVPAVGSEAPDFTLPDQDDRARRLSEWRGRWVVLYFFPKSDTPVCTAEACHFRDDWQQLGALGVQVLGVSIDTSATHRAFAEKYHLPFPLLADARGEVAARYGALSDWLLVKFAKRYTFVIDPQGRIAKAYLSVDADRHAAEVLADLKRLGAGRS